MVLRQIEIQKESKIGTVKEDDPFELIDQKPVLLIVEDNHDIVNYLDQLLRDEYKLEKYRIDLDEARYGLANMQLVARDRMREIKLWSQLKKEVDDGTFDKQNVNTHQLESYHKIMLNRKDTLTAGSSQPEVFNVLGQLQTIERVKKEKAQLEGTKREALSQESKLGAKPE